MSVCDWERQDGASARSRRRAAYGRVLHPTTGEYHRRAPASAAPDPDFIPFPERRRRITDPDPKFVAEFNALADQWDEETRFSSSTTEIVMHPAYQRIMTFGMSAVPLILQRLRVEPAQWFWALQRIVDLDPARGQDTVDGAASAWVSWGEKVGLLS